jgi:hypothetical protein
MIGRQSWFSSHNLDSAPAAKMRTCAVARRLGPGSRMTQQHLLTRSGILHTIENLLRPKVPKGHGKAGRHSWESSLQRAEPKPPKHFAGALIRREGTPTISIVSSETVFLEPLPITLGRVFGARIHMPPTSLVSEQGERYIIQLNNNTSHKA